MYTYCAYRKGGWGGDLGGRSHPAIQAARHLKTLPNLFKSPPKMLQNRQQNGPKSRSGGGLSGPWAPFGRLLGGSWLQGISGPPLGGHLGSSWAVLKPSWASLGRLLGRPGHQVGASWGVLEASWPQLGRPNPPKSLNKSMPRCISSWNPFFDRFLGDFCFQLQPPKFN